MIDIIQDWLHYNMVCLLYRMDSFVLAETFKYLFLLYAEKSDLVLDVDDYIFTTEAHLLPLSLSLCNSTRGPPQVSILYLIRMVLR